KSRDRSRRKSLQIRAASTRSSSTLSRNGRDATAGSVLLALDFVGVANGRGERARLAGLRFAQERQPLRVSPVYAALGDDVIHRDIPTLRVDGVDARQLVGDADGDGLFHRRGEGAVEEAAAVAQPVSLHVPAVR